MIDEKTYFKAMKRIPLIKCPDNVVSQIFKACDIPDVHQKPKFNFLLRETAYGCGCIIIIAIIFLMGIRSYGNQTGYDNCIAANSRLLVSQFANGASVLLTEKIK